jgi:HEAT repeat protein
MLADPGEKLRASLIKLIIETNYQPALPAVRVLLLDETTRSRNLALAAVKEMNDHESVKQVRWMCYHDPSPYTRSFALNVLYSLLGAESLPDLLLLAKDTNSNVRRDVVLYLSKISPLPIEAVASLHELAHDPILGIQQTALAILTSLEQQNILVEEIVLPIQPLESLFPPEMNSDLPYLLAILKKWQDSLERKHPTENSVEMDRTIDAIAQLIELLIASHDGNVRG